MQRVHDRDLLNVKVVQLQEELQVAQATIANQVRQSTSFLHTGWLMQSVCDAGSENTADGYKKVNNIGLFFSSW